MLPNLIVPVLNRYDLLQRMLKSVDTHIGQLIIIDNGGEFENMFERPDWANKAYLLTLPSNLGVAGSWNLGIKLLPHAKTWFFASNDVQFRPGALDMLSTATEGSLTLSQRAPHWQAFAIGEAVIRRCGLFDERLYPAYFEDNDMMRRVQLAGLPITYLPIDVGHDNSSTLRSDPKFAEHNQRTFEANRKLYEAKLANRDIGEGWDLDRRRAGEWQAID